MWSVDGDIDKGVENIELRHVDGDETAVSIMDKQIAVECSHRVIVNTACAVGNVSHKRLDTRAELGENVGEGDSKEELSFW